MNGPSSSAEPSHPSPTPPSEVTGPPAGEAAAAPSAASADGAPPSAFTIGLRPLALSAPWRWLALGWQDFRRAPGLGLFYGACFAGMGILLAIAYAHAPAYVLALSAGFLLVGPFLCLGLYQTSRRLEAGEKPEFSDSVMAWERRMSALAIFGFVLLVLEMLWARASLVVFAISFDGMPDFQGSIAALLRPDNLQFILTYIAVGGIFAAVIYAVSVVSIPMILDLQTDAITTALTSLRLVLTQPAVMVLWGAVITLVVALAMLPWFLGLLVAGPVIGHASWHAYREAVQRPGDPA